MPKGGQSQLPARKKAGRDGRIFIDTIKVFAAAAGFAARKTWGNELCRGSKKGEDGEGKHQVDDGRGGRGDGGFQDCRIVKAASGGKKKGGSRASPNGKEKGKRC